MRSAGLLPDVDYTPLTSAADFRLSVERIADFDVRVAMPRGYRGRRARKAAFAHRARLARYLMRLCKGARAEHERRLANVIIYGCSHPEMFAWTEAAPVSEEAWRRLGKG